MALANVWVLAQAADGAPTGATLELLTKARALGETVSAFVAGDGAPIAAALGEYGAATVYSTGPLGDALPGPAVAAAIEAVIEGAATPDLILFPQDYVGRDVLARLSVRLDRTVLTNNVDITVEGGTVRVVTQVFGGKTLVTTTFTGAAPYLAAFRPKSFVAEPGGAAAGAVVAAPVPDLGSTGAAKVVARHAEEATGPKLDEAAVVVAGGRGLKAQDNVALIEELAALLKGAPAASRAIVDAGWVPYALQVGQTGKVVKPDVYVAAGISGATQHLVGMKGSKAIIAINTDEHAAIFDVADLGIVGDALQVLPKLIEALKAR